MAEYAHPEVLVTTMWVAAPIEKEQAAAAG